MEEERLRINVRSLAEFYFEGGDLVSGRGMIQRMLEGTRAHRLAQGGYEPGWQSEAALRMELERRGVKLLLHGRADGLLAAGDDSVIEEIKSMLEDTAGMEGGEYPVHWAQAELYAAMLAARDGLNRVRVRLRYISLAGGEALFTRDYSREKLYEKLDEYLSPMLDWLARVRAWQDVSRPTMRALSFPYGVYRPGQREMAANVYVALRDGKNLLCQAPTGIGKTAAALFPALIALGEGRVGRVFYLTARTTGREAALQALDRMRAAGLMARCVVLSAKDSVCPMEERDCRPEACPLARGYYDRRRDALREALSMQRLDRAAIGALAARHGICPFELSLDLSETADVVVCDYNYVFDPRVKLQRFFTGRSDAGLLVDEAHNLASRARDMLSGALAQRYFRDLRRAVGKEAGRKHPLYAALTALLKEMTALRRSLGGDSGGESRAEKPDALIEAAKAFAQAAGAAFDERTWACRRDLSECFFDALDFLRAESGYDEHFRTLIEPDGRNLCGVRLWCADPAAHIAACLRRVHGAALFSATLAPMDFYRDLTGLDGEADALLDLPSPFPPENLRALVCPLPLRYKEREASMDRLCECLRAFIGARRGNYLVCFPSYAFMRQAAERVEWPCRLLVQSPDMDDDARRAFLDALEPDPPETTAAFVVMGGVFSEGVDLPGGRLAGAAIVGTGVPQLSLEGDTLRALYEEKYGRGYAYAYMYPGVAKVLQAAGRVIRSESDRGAVLLIDARWRDAEHRALMPPHWRAVPARGPEEIEAELETFWNER
ncbi:MAG: ATP-dependent DNA helicase [Clostridia bacterium]|nr:ATP-dependent DNA helicase [Clostridia bacterium]